MSGKLAAAPAGADRLPAGGIDRVPVSYERIEIARVVIADDRLRKADPAKVDAIAHSYGLVGQLQPIRVARNGDGDVFLDIGLHRILAGSKVGWTHIDAGVISVLDLTLHERRLQEIFENLIRAELTALDRAVNLAELKAVHEGLYPETKNGGDAKARLKQKENRQNEIFAFSQATAERTGLSKRSIELAVAIAKGLGAAVRTRLQGTSLADHQAGLKALSEQPEKTQHKVLDLLLAPVPSVSSVADALVVAAGKKLPSPAETKFRTLSDGLARCSAKERQKLYALHEKEILAWAEGRLKSGGGVQMTADPMPGQISIIDWLQDHR